MLPASFRCFLPRYCQYTAIHTKIRTFHSLQNQAKNKDEQYKGKPEETVVMRKNSMNLLIEVKIFSTRSKQKNS